MLINAIRQMHFCGGIVREKQAEYQEENYFSFNFSNQKTIM